jgi:uncharacterized protein YqjF (DUF2071 family)
MLTSTPPTQQQRLAVRQRPDHPAVMYMRWEQLLFLHWACDPADVQATLPPGLFVDTFDGRAWLGVVPFFMHDVRPVGLPPMPWVSDFLELNVRTYAYDARGVPGVWFYSLDCNQPLAVEAARRLFHLNYRHAEMSASIDPVTGGVSYRARRRDADKETRFRYRATGDLRPAAPGSLDFFLVERYVLFAHDGMRLGTGRVSHLPYEIRNAEVGEWDEVMLDLNGFAPSNRIPDHICATRAQEVAATRVVF